MNVTEYLTDLLDAEDLRPATRRVYASTIRVHVVPLLGDTPVSDLTPATLRGFFADLRRRGVGPGATAGAYRLLSKMLKAAVADGLLERNPMDSVKPPRAVSARKDPPTPGEVAAIVLAIDPRYRAMLELMAWTGLRVGEAGGLRVEDWDSERRRLSIHRQETRTGTANLKTAAARRTVYVPSQMATKLDRHLMQFPPVDGRIFSTRNGGPVHSDIFYPVFRSGCRRAGVRSFHPHELRHHAVSAMVRSGASLKAVQAVVGHASSKMTLDVYSHVTEEDLKDVADRLE